jgi:predicted  nucleic acid-binding Zn-ribbon protein
MNSLGDDGAFAVASVIGTNACITFLSLASCRITDKGALELASALVQNSTLRKFKINDNFLTRECGYGIIDALRGNEHLFLLDLTATQIDHFVIKAARDLCIRNKQIQKETDLQPLKKQLVQLSIQQTKMPEAEMRLKELDTNLAKVEDEITNLEMDLDAAQIHSAQELSQLTKAIEEKKVLILEEEKAIETLASDTEKTVAEYDKRHEEILGNTEKEKAAISRLEQEANGLDEKMKVTAAEAAEQQAALEKEIADLEALIASTFEMMKDPEVVRNYTPPELDFLKALAVEDEPFFLVDQISSLAGGEAKDGKKKGKKGKKSKK